MKASRLAAGAAVSWAAATWAAATAATAARVAKLVLSDAAGHIYLADFDGAAFRLRCNASVGGAPTWLAFSPPSGSLYAVDENSATTMRLDVDLQAGTVTPSANVTSANGIVHLEFSGDGGRMLGAAYGSAGVAVFNTAGGGLEYLRSVASSDRGGPVPGRQDKPHPHQTVRDPSGRFFAVNDLGTDRILVLDGRDDAFAVVNHVPVAPAGCGPRHGAFYPAGAARASHYLVVCEMRNLVNLYAVRYGGPRGIDFFFEQSLSTLPPGAGAVSPTAAAGELVLSRDSRNVYVSNRLVDKDKRADDSIASFRVVPAGASVKLELLGLTPTGGRLPRMFSQSADGETLFVANQAGGLGLVALRRKPDGTVADAPVASVAMGEFPGGNGPAFVQQIA
ncbi:uncharacterized protein UV8b_07828 [Ustilaginoidea virens]|uniref:Uncharacterized protein n=1 Tax=Ustilaginoidea virens TaxID=1159556 RepID=A0A063BTD5_USTVR|nr:uncharacterized protein UV8b_07828 [Ustilaginoidea virens]QUC23587.1 hypothetical protein UV8b_07828 [Ustilaginoidea virens]GAO17065.1 hypothetical protein UVI_02003380 [Ustilaginoidea virens]